jgi:protein-arginine kinase activator protein McsA
MLCTKCGARPSEVTYTEIGNGPPTVHHLCGSCFAEVGDAIKARADAALAGTSPEERTEARKAIDTALLAYKEGTLRPGHNPGTG